MTDGAAAGDPGVDLDLEVNLRLDVEGDEIAIYDREGAIVVDAGSFGAVRRFLDGVGSLPVGPERLRSLVESAGIEGHVEVRHVVVARFGPDVSPGPVSKRLTRRWGLPAAIRFEGVGLALARRFL